MAEKPFFKTFIRVLGFSMVFQLTSWFYIWSLVPRPLTHGDIVLLFYNACH